MLRKLPVFFALLALMCGAAVSAQDNVVVGGLTNPRGIAYDEDGTLFIAEAGLAGDVEAQGPFGPVLTGTSSRVVMVEDDGEVTPVLQGFNSTQGFGDYVGVQAILIDDQSIWLALGDGPLGYPINHAVLGLDKESMRVHTFIDLFSFEANENPDAEDVASNPSDIAIAADGTLYIIDTSGNSLLRWTVDGGLELFAAWEELPVPTSVALDDEGNIYVGFLTAFPFPAGGATVEKWSPEGELLTTYEGLTGVTDVAIGADGTIYAVQIADGFGDNGWNPNSGSVVTVATTGITSIAEGLPYPYAVAFAPDGTLSVSVNSSFAPAGGGQVISIAL